MQGVVNKFHMKKKKHGRAGWVEVGMGPSKQGEYGA